jgi:hypothetical protein
VPQQHAPSRFLKVAVVSRFLAQHPKVSRFIVEHPKASRFILSVAHLLPVFDHYIPFALPLAPAYNPRDQHPRRPAFRG